MWGGRFDGKSLVPPLLSMAAWPPRSVQGPESQQQDEPKEEGHALGLKPKAPKIPQIGRAHV